VRPVKQVRPVQPAALGVTPCRPPAATSVEGFPDMRAGGGVGFARLLHASANEALQVFLARHRQFSFERTTAHSPAAP